MSIWPPASHLSRRLLAMVVLAMLPAGGASLAAEVPPSTDAGTFEGTWFRVEPGQRQALQIRKSASGEGYEVRLYWWTGEDFSVDTEWRAETRYVWRAYPGLLKVEPLSAESNRDELVFLWMRDQEGTRASHLIESGTARVFRTGQDGRKLAFVIDPLIERVTVGEPIAPYEGDVRERTTKRVWIMLKVANRLVPWDEIPW